MKVKISFPLKVDPESWRNEISDPAMPDYGVRRDIQSWAKSQIVMELSDKGVLMP